MTSNLFKYAKKFLPVIGLFILLYIVYSLDFEEIQSAFLSVKPLFVFIVLLLTIPRILIRNFAWQLIQREQNIKIGYFRSLKIFLIGYFYCSITPGYLGQLMRIPYMKEETGEPYGKLFVNSSIESIVHSFSLYIMVIFGSILLIEQFPEVLPIAFAWILGLVVFIFYFIKKERGERLFFGLIKYFIPKRYKSNLNSFVNTFYNDFPSIKRLFLPFVLGIFTWVIIFSQEYIIVLALGLDIPYFYFLLLFSVANVVGFIPITFAGLGTRELAAIVIFTTLFAVSEEKIFVVSLLGFILTDVFTGFVGFLTSLTEAKVKKV